MLDATTFSIGVGFGVDGDDDAGDGDRTGAGTSAGDEVVGFGKDPVSLSLLLSRSVAVSLRREKIDFDEDMRPSLDFFFSFSFFC